MASFKAGFNKQPYIINPYAMEQLMTSRVKLPAPTGRQYTPEYKKYVDQFFQQIKEATVKENFPEPPIHGRDEAKHGEKLDESIRVLKSAKEHGFKTVATCYIATFNNPTSGYDAFVDFRNYANPGFWDLHTPERTEKARKSAEKSGDVFWSYGSGCYANSNPPGSHFRNVRQDGCLTENRYLHGLFIHRAKLKAEWSWTFSRWQGDPMNDFDNPRKRCEAKEQCIVYPGKNSVTNQDTLQWEALRQGWQDYRAIYTLEKTLKERSDSKAKAIKTELDKKIKEIPWRNYTQYPSGKIEELRAWMLEKIYQLQK